MRVPTVFCGNDYREMQCIKSGAIVETISNGTPYYKISVDIYECEYCQARSVIPAKAPIAEAHQEVYNHITISEFEGNYIRLSFIN